MFGVTLHSRGDCSVCRKIAGDGRTNVLVSMAETAPAAGGNRTRHNCGVCSGTVKNSVGAGDSMLAGFLAGLEQAMRHMR
ncbi:MAG: PfkB family carbohydrate kinase [Ruminococcus callidus]